MKIVLYILLSTGVIYLFVTFLLEKFRSEKNTGNPADSAIPDLGLALKVNKKARAEFALKCQVGKKAPVKRSLSEGSKDPELTQSPTMISNIDEGVSSPIHAPISSPIPSIYEKKAHKPLEQKEEMHFTATIQRIIAPHIVEQGQKNRPISVVVRNLSQVPLHSISIQLRFQREKDISSQFTVRAQAGNPLVLNPNEMAKYSLTIDINPTATLGKITIIPILSTHINGRLCNVEVTTSKMFQWTVEPTGRKFEITTNHQGKETAGQPFSVSLKTYHQGNLDTNYEGAHRIYFSLEGSSAISSSSEIPDHLDLLFKAGQAETEEIFCLYNILEQYILLASDNEAGGAKGKTTPLEMKPSELGGFQLNITSPQTNKSQWKGDNLLTAIDFYNNVKIDYSGEVEISCNTPCKIQGLSGAGNIVSKDMFQNGVAYLNDITVEMTNLGEEGKLVQFVALADGKNGYSDKISILPASQSPLDPSRTQAAIRDILGKQKNKIWLVNCEKDLEKLLADNFNQDYSVDIVEIQPGEVAKKLTSPFPDVIFLDSSQSPALDYQILQEIRKIPSMETLPILFLGSASASEQEISEVLRSGSGYLTKPPSISAIRAMIADLQQKASLGRGKLPIQGSRLQGSGGVIYQVVSKIGEGGMGYIYEARNLRNQNKVIIKYLPPAHIKNLKSIVRFVQEAHTVLSFEHQNLVRGYDAYMDINRCFYVMEYIEGKSLEQIIRSQGKLVPVRAMRIVLQVARALQVIEEEHNLIHRDIKPANILVTPQDMVKLVDFGISKLTDHNHKLTTEGIILGTPYYLSPEQIQGEKVSIQSDIYSLGATFYHMITGQVPFQGQDVYSIIQQRLVRLPKDPRTLNPSIPKGASEIIMNMMQIDLAKRYQSPRALIYDLERVLQFIDSGRIALEEETLRNDETQLDMISEDEFII